MEAYFHESEDRLELYALGRLADSEVEQIEEHLIVCEACRNQLEQTGEPALALRDELLKRAAQGTRFGEWFKWLTPSIAMSGAFAALVLALGVYWVGTGSRPGPVASLQLTAMRGEMPSVGLVRGVDLTLTDAPDAGGPFSVQVVDGSGGNVWKGTPTSSAQGLRARIGDRLSPGDYFVRLYGAKGELVHEYGFRVIK